jgi:hypothetical protein
MNLDHCTATEHGDHFMVDRGDGKPFRVAKAALSPALRERVRGMCRGGVVKMADGGEVPESSPENPASPPLPYDDWTHARQDERNRGAFPQHAYVPDPAPVPLPLPIAATEPGPVFLPPTSPPSMASMVPAVMAPAIAAEEGTAQTGRGFGVMGSALADAVTPAAADAAALPDGLPPVAGAITAPGGLSRPDDGSPDDINLTGVPKGQIREYQPVDAPKLVLPPEGAFTAARPPAGVAVPSTTGPKIVAGKPSDELAAASRQQQDAARALGEAQAQRADAQEAAAAQALAQREALAAESAQKMKAAEARRDALREQVLKSEIDPNRLMGSLSTGQKVTAVLGMLLGGIGAGLSHGPSYAMQVIDDAIGRDIRAQEAKKDSLFRMYADAGHDADSAASLARSDTQTVIAARLEKAALTAGSAEARARIGQIVGALRADAAKAQQDWIAKDFTNRNQRNVVQQEVDAKAADIAAKKQAMGLNAAGAAQEGVRNQIIARAMSGDEVQAAELAALPEKLADQMIQTRAGFFTKARNQSAADGVAKVEAQADVIKDALTRYEALRKEHSSGVFGTDRTGKAEAKQIRSSLTGSLKELLNLGALSESDYDLLYNQIPDITDVSFSDAGAASIASLRRDVDSRVQATRNRNLMRPMRSGMTPDRKAGG